MITPNGYKLTMFRCNSKEFPLQNKKVAIFLHGFVSSSDDIVMNMPGQGLGKMYFTRQTFKDFVFATLFDAQIIAYVLADANFDVWIPNCRGNFYSRENLFMDPDDLASGYWDFSWDDIAFEGIRQFFRYVFVCISLDFISWFFPDFPVIFNYIRTVTRQPKFYVIAHSKGTSSILALLSSRPEFNSQMHAVSLMAPIGYLKNSVLLNATIDIVMKQFQV